VGGEEEVIGERWVRTSVTLWVQDIGNVGHMRRIGRAKASARRPQRTLYRFIRAGLEPRVVLGVFRLKPITVTAD